MEFLLRLGRLLTLFYFIHSTSAVFSVPIKVKMRTSPSQFLLLVEFMERNGDLSKPTEGLQGKTSNYKLWSELTSFLNADSTGDTKTLDKWRKVWSDLKNNTKKKAARIHRAAMKTGGGPASHLKLSDLEQRVLCIIGSRAATGMIEIPEIGIEEAVAVTTNDASPSIFFVHEQTPHVEEWNLPGPSGQLTIGGAISTDRAPSVAREELGETEPNDNIAAISQHPQSGGHGFALPPATARLPSPPSPLPLPPTPRRRRRRLVQASPANRRTRTQTQSDLARQAFVRSDCEWRSFQQETERERIRLRQVELSQQDRWLDLFAQFLALSNRIVTYLEKK